MRADPAGDPLAGDREPAGRRQRRLHRPDDAVLENHCGEAYADLTGPPVPMIIWPSTAGQRRRAWRPTGTWKAPGSRTATATRGVRATSTSFRRTITAKAR